MSIIIMGVYYPNLYHYSPLQSYCTPISLFSSFLYTQRIKN